MAAILANNNFKCIFFNENDRIQIPISLKFLPRGPIDNKPALVQVMAWCWTGNKPLSVPMLTQYTDACIQHQGRWVNKQGQDRFIHNGLSPIQCQAIVWTNIGILFSQPLGTNVYECNMKHKQQDVYKIFLITSAKITNSTVIAHSTHNTDIDTGHISACSY